MEIDITCGDCKHFTIKRIPLPESDQPYRRGRKREEKVGWCSIYETKTGITQFYGQCDSAKRVVVELEKPSLQAADPK